MKKSTIYCIIGLIGLLFVQSVAAKVTLPELIADGMVIQRDIENNIWGRADAGEQVVVAFLNKTYSTKADNEGNWQIQLPPMSSGGPFVMTINEHTLKDILIGDVWLCSGQSNMELPVSRVMEMFRDEVQEYEKPNIRHLKVPLSYNFHEPQQDIGTVKWQTLTAENALSFSAVAYFFARDLYEKTGVPIGLINSSVGGSPAEAWISEKELERFPQYLNELHICRSDEYVQDVKTLDSKRRNHWNNVLYKNDAGINEAIKWFSESYDDSSWQTYDLFDNSWGSDGLNPVNGTHWLRRSFVLDATQEGEATKLYLGCIVDADSVFVNGTFIGTTGYQYPPRIYQIPKQLLKKGENNITVRLISYSGKPGFVKEKPYKIAIGNDEINLTGEWKYKLGVRMPQLQGETFFQYKPAGLYNSMIAPLQQFNIKGMLWYQGESNVSRYNDYFDLMETLISNWRDLWKNETLPFLIVQLSAFMQDGDKPGESHWAELRNIQSELSKNIANTGLVVTTDIGEWNDIHPLNKKDVGKRLSLLAQNIAYHFQDVTGNGPVFKSVISSNGSLILTFEEKGGNLMPVEKLKGFAIAGIDGRFEWADAVIINDNKVVIRNENIPRPVKVRYAWGNNPQEANLKNNSGLPASPFEASIKVKE